MSEVDACLLCESRNIIIDETISGGDVSSLYMKLEVTDLILPEYFDFLHCDDCGLKWFVPTLTADEEFYKCLQNNDWYYQQDKPEFDYASLAVDECRSIVEIGCGAGHFSHFLHPKANYIGLEFNEEAIIKAGSKGVDVRKQTIQEFAMEADHSIDAVVSFQVLEHVSDPRGFLNSCSDILNVGGKLILSVPNEESFLADVTNGCLNLPPHHVTRWSRRTFEKWALCNKFEIEEVFLDSVAPYHLIWWRSTLIQSHIRSLFSMSHRQVDLSFGWIAISKFCSALARLLPIKGENSVGHSITVVMRKAG